MMRSGANVDCHFESEFKCGYESSVIGPLSWSRTNGASLQKKFTGPSTDSAGSTTGKLMCSLQYTAFADKHGIECHRVANNLDYVKPVAVL